MNLTDSPVQGSEHDQSLTEVTKWGQCNTINSMVPHIHHNDDWELEVIVTGELEDRLM